MKTNITLSRTAIEAAASTFQNDLASADSVRSASLSGLQRLLTARASHAQREQQRLSQELGVGDAQVIQIQTDVAADLQFARLLGVEIDRINARVPIISKDGWAVFGFVWNSQWIGQPNLTVGIFDQSGTLVRQFGLARTDDKGYFALPVSTTRLQTNIATEASRSGSTSIFLHALDQKGTALFVDQVALTPTPGTVEYRPIILKATSPSRPPVVAATSSSTVKAARKPQAKKRSRKTGK
jgi:hypothetical protein